MKDIRMQPHPKKLLILGGSDNQVRLVKTAQEAGIYTIVCSYTTTCPAKDVCDKFYNIDYLDRERVRSLAKEEEIDGIISNSEAAMLTVAYVSEKLGLPGNSVKGIERLISKSKFRKLQTSCGLYAPKSFECITWDEYTSQINSLHFPIIIKPSESSGTRGTTRIDLSKDIEAQKKSFEECKTFSVNKRVSVEEFVEMPSLEVIDGDVFVNGDDFLWNGFFTCYRSDMAPMVPMIESFPINITSETFNDVKASIRCLFKEAGVKHGQYNVEMYYTRSGELFIIEINARQGGNNIPHLIELHSGIDYDKLLVTTAVGDRSYFNDVKSKEHLCRYISQYVVFSRKDGILKGIDISEEIKKYLIEKTDLRETGDFVRNCQNAADKISLLVFEFDDFDKQIHYNSQMEKMIVSIVK